MRALMWIAAVVASNLLGLDLAYGSVPHRFHLSFAEDQTVFFDVAAESYQISDTHLIFIKNIPPIESHFGTDLLIHISKFSEHGRSFGCLLDDYHSATNRSWLNAVHGHRSEFREDLCTVSPDEVVCASLYHDVLRRGCPKILHAKVQDETGFYNAECTLITSEIGSGLRFADLAVVSNGRSSLRQRQIEGEKAAEAENQSGDRSEDHPKSEVRHRLLSGKIILALLGLAGGFYNLFYALKNAERISVGAFFLHSLFGVTCILVGVLVGAVGVLTI